MKRSWLTLLTIAFVVLNAGYRVFDLEDPTIESLNPSAGFLIGRDWSW